VPEHGVAVPIEGGGSLDVAWLDPGSCLRRWVADACAGEEERARLLASPYFIALADRLAAFTDAIGCARAVEWAEREPDLAELVLDTAPGASSIELLARPEKLMAFFDGRLVQWLTGVARAGDRSLIGRGSRRLMKGLGTLSGSGALQQMGELVSALETAIATMVARLERARRWLQAPTTSLVITCGVSDDAAATALSLDGAVRALGLSPTLIVLNRVLPASLLDWSTHFGDEAPPQARAFARYVRGYVNTQQRVRLRLDAERVPVIEVPDTATLDHGDRLGGLAALGEPLRLALHPAAGARFKPSVAAA